MSLAAEKASFHALNVGTFCAHRTLAKLKKSYGTWEGAWDAVGKNFALDPRKTWQDLEDLAVSLILPEEGSFPHLLKEIPLAPHGLYVKGEAPILNRKGVSLVGTRKPTPRGAAVAAQFAGDIAKRGLTVISGLAFGIDSASHGGCIGAGGETIAVLPSGLDRIYPRSNELLAKKILEGGGALVSEFPPGSEIFAYNFLQRNRIISGLSVACCLIEVPIKSGALATARFALDQNREVLVVPGAIWDSHYAGSNRLIQEGARLAASSADIFEAIGLEIEEGSAAKIRAETEEEGIIIEALRTAPGPASIDKIRELTTLNIRTVTETLTFLVLRNVVKETDAGFTL
jgi:DNA processing protein